MADKGIIARWQAEAAAEQERLAEIGEAVLDWLADRGWSVRDDWNGHTVRQLLTREIEESIEAPQTGERS